MAAEREPEIQRGVVIELGGEFTKVEISGAEGSGEVRIFETTFLSDIGVERAGDGIELRFSQWVENGEGVVEMRVRCTGPTRSPEEVYARIRKLVDEVNLDLLRGKFGSHRSHR